LRVLGVW